MKQNAKDKQRIQELFWVFYGENLENVKNEKLIKTNR